jgi:uncharacterized protein YcfJ
MSRKSLRANSFSPQPESGGPPAGNQHRRTGYALLQAAPSRQQRRDVRGMVLPITVERGDHRCPRQAHTCAHCRALAAVVTVLYHHQPGMCAGIPQQDVSGVVAGKVVDEDRLEGGNAGQRGFDFIEKRHDIAGFVVHRHNHGDFRSRWGHGGEFT